MGACEKNISGIFTNLVEELCILRPFYDTVWFDSGAHLMERNIWFGSFGWVAVDHSKAEVETNDAEIGNDEKIFLCCFFTGPVWTW